MIGAVRRLRIRRDGDRVDLLEQARTCIAVLGDGDGHRRLARGHTVDRDAEVVGVDPDRAVVVAPLLVERAHELLGVGCHRGVGGQRRVPEALRAEWSDTTGAERDRRGRGGGRRAGRVARLRPGRRRRRFRAGLDEERRHHHGHDQGGGDECDRAPTMLGASALGAPRRDVKRVTAYSRFAGRDLHRCPSRGDPSDRVRLLAPGRISPSGGGTRRLATTTRGR